MLCQSYVNWFTIPYIGSKKLLAIEQFNEQGIRVDSEVMLGPDNRSKIDKKAIANNNKAIGLGTHISCFKTKQKLSAYLQKKAA